MRICDILKQNRISISLELFPPKAGGDFANSLNIAKETAELGPSFISVTYGAGGGSSLGSLEVAKAVQAAGVPCLSHLTCVSATKSGIKSTLAELETAGIKNILSLRGDIPTDSARAAEQFKHASDLTSLVKSYGDFCVGGACYPEMHPESNSLKSDLGGLRLKQDAGCEFLMTQMFFDNDIFFRFVEQARSVDINIPIIAGVMPVTNAVQIKRIVELSGTKLPKKFVHIVENFAGNPAAMKQAGIIYACDQIVDMIARGQHSFHVYTMNKPDVARAIFENLSEIAR